MISFIYFLILIIVLILIFTRKNNNYKNKIYSYWEGEPNKLVEKCHERMEQLNPDSKVTILKHKNLIPFSFNRKNIRTETEKADMIRIIYLEKYGGTWIDASIISLKSNKKWINTMYKKYNVKKNEDVLIGYSFPFDERIMENWFIHCSKNCSFMKLWKQEYLKAVEIGPSNYCSSYKNFCQKEFPSLWNSLPYLTMHLCFCVVLKTKKYKTRIILEKSCDGPFEYLCQSNWNEKEAIKNLTDTYQYNLNNITFIKLRGKERDIVSTLDTKEFKPNSILFQLYH